MRAEHTPTPWRLAGQATLRTDIGHSPSDEWIGSVHWRNRAANAEFIVRAANAHDDLVAALRKARNIILQMGLPDEATDRVLLESGNAIDKAEGRS
jgi:hypothetical protein